MKINLTTTFSDQLGGKIKNGEEQLTMGDVITSALLTPMKEDEKLSGEEKAELFNIWFDQIKDKKEADLKPEQVVKIKERIGKAYAQIIVGQSFKILN